MDVNKKDWKLFVDCLPEWQERYMEKLGKEYVELLLRPDKQASEKFWELEKTIKKDKKSPGVMLELRKSDMEYDIMRLLKDKVISMDDLSDFSDELRERVKSFAE